MLGRVAQEHYGTLSMPGRELRIEEFGSELGLELRFFQTNSEAEFVDHLHRLEGMADGILLNPGAWTHYSWAIHDALEIAALPPVEGPLSAVHGRGPRRRGSVESGPCPGTVRGQWR